MRTRLVLTASAFLAGASVLPAQAQYYDNDYDGSVVRCESRDNRTERCAVGGGGDIRLVRQLSSNACVRGRNWGTDSRGIWVSGGCRAEFSIGGYGGYDDDRYGGGYDDRYGGGYGNDGAGTFRCESTNNRTERCASAGRPEFIRQLSNTPCVRGQSWGTDSRGVWVSNGCRALFRTGGYGNGYGNNGGYNNGGYGGSDLIRCESNDNRSRSCNFTGNSRGEIRLLRQLSGKPCVENQTWGRSRNGVWVTQGCRAEFVIGRGNRGGNPRPPGANVRPPGDLGNGIPGGQQPGVLQPGVFQNRPGREGSQRPPAQTVVERPRGYQDNTDASPGGRQIRPVEETQPAAPVRPVERPVAQVEQRNTGGAAQPGVVEEAPAPRGEPAPREREGTIQRGERPH